MPYLSRLNRTRLLQDKCRTLLNTTVSVNYMIKLFHIVVILVTVGCTPIDRAFAPWDVIVEDGPLSGKNEKAVLEARYYSTMGMPSHDLRLRTQNGKTINAKKLTNDIVSYLEKKGHLATWPDTGAHINSMAQKLSPYRIHVVSVFPTIVILKPHDYGTISGRSIDSIVGFQSRNALHDDRLINHIILGSSLPISDSLFWFSPDLDVNITPVEKSSDGKFFIRGRQLVLTGNSSGLIIDFVSE